MNELSHLDNKGNASMVDVGEKSNTKRVAIAIGSVSMKRETLEVILSGNNKKGDVFSVAKIAGIQAAKNCSQLIPLCHPLMLTSVKLDFTIEEDKLSLIHISEPTRPY